MELLNVEEPRLKERIYQGEDALPKKIRVENHEYNFNEKIENEWISDFPEYSYRMRANFVKGVEIVDEFLNQLTESIPNYLYRYYESELTRFTWLYHNQETEFTNLYTSHSGKVTQLENRVQELLQEGRANDNKLGLVTKNEVKEISQNIANSILRSIGLNSYDENNSKVNTSDIGNTRKSGFYFVPNLFGNSSAIVFNYVYNQANENKLWGVQLGIEESDNPRLYVRSKRNGTWKNWSEIASKKYIDDFKNEVRERKSTLSDLIDVICI